jgi:hypothetical protein
MRTPGACDKRSQTRHAMASTAHPAATHYLPGFITAPGETDVLMVVMGIVLLLAILGFGILFFRLHSLPEQIAHKSQKIQLEIVAVLGLISLFTHMHIFWVIGLLLALVELPDFGTPLGRIARSTERIAGIEPKPTAPSLVPDAGSTHRAETTAPVPNAETDRKDGNSAIAKPNAGPARSSEVGHA